MKPNRIRMRIIAASAAGTYLPGVEYDVVKGEGSASTISEALALSYLEAGACVPVVPTPERAVKPEPEKRAEPDEETDEPDEEPEPEDDEDPLPRWPMRITPEEYLKRFPDGPAAELAQRYVDQGEDS